MTLTWKADDIYIYLYIYIHIDIKKRTRINNNSNIIKNTTSFQVKYYQQLFELMIFFEIVIISFYLFI